MWGMIATWRMAQEGVRKGYELLKKGETAGNVIETAIQRVEEFPYYQSVGYGGLPNEEQEVELDAAYMDGDTLSVGAVAAVKAYARPIAIARRLSQEKVNIMLVGEGAEKFARKEGFERKNMLTDFARAKYQKRLQKIREEENKKQNNGTNSQEAVQQMIQPYAVDDTVGMVCLYSH